MSSTSARRLSLVSFVQLESSLSPDCSKCRLRRLARRSPVRRRTLEPSPDGQIPCGRFPTGIVATNSGVAPQRNAFIQAPRRGSYPGDLSAIVDSERYCQFQAGVTPFFQRTAWDTFPGVENRAKIDAKRGNRAYNANCLGTRKWKSLTKGVWLDRW